MVGAVTGRRAGTVIRTAPASNAPPASTAADAFSTANARRGWVTKAPTSNHAVSASPPPPAMGQVTPQRPTLSARATAVITPLLAVPRHGRTTTTTTVATA